MQISWLLPLTFLCKLSFTFIPKLIQIFFYFKHSKYFQFSMFKNMIRTTNHKILWNIAIVFIKLLMIKNISLPYRKIRALGISICWILTMILLWLSVLFRIYFGQEQLKSLFLSWFCVILTNWSSFIVIKKIYIFSKSIMFISVTYLFVIINLKFFKLKLNFLIELFSILHKFSVYLFFKSFI